MTGEKSPPDNTHLSSAREPGRGYHDLGGLPAGPVPMELTEARPWEKLSIVLGNSLGTRGAKVICTDETRRTREEMGVQLYNESGYFERGVHALTAILLERGVVTQDELDARMAQIAKRIKEDGR
jgi:hypothetical protein